MSLLCNGRTMCFLGLFLAVFNDTFSATWLHNLEWCDGWAHNELEIMWKEPLMRRIVRCYLSTRTEEDHEIPESIQSIFRLSIWRVSSTWQRLSVQKMLESATIRKDKGTLWFYEQIASREVYGQTNTCATWSWDFHGATLFFRPRVRLSLLTKATGCELGQEFFSSLLLCPDRLWSPHNQPSDYLSGLKRTEHDAGHSHPYNAEIKVCAELCLHFPIHIDGIVFN
jgi:hypothetical protein